jgi:hypothetical protein
MVLRFIGFLRKPASIRQNCLPSKQFLEMVERSPGPGRGKKEISKGNIFSSLLERIGLLPEGGDQRSTGKQLTSGFWKWVVHRAKTS